MSKEILTEVEKKHISTIVENCSEAFKSVDVNLKNAIVSVENLKSAFEKIPIEYFVLMGFCRKEFFYNIEKQTEILQRILK